ncbi:MAG: hypothetical protein RBG13Loki_2228 [Promethearchaeota archaeon CR_4]|nr:MAG: hypothetical protein RBG13Loki_2228 [Candidatus Lokiarchaeota archaeon CR_4]
MKYIDCCGAYCRTCKTLTQSACTGCKLGYENGERDVSKAKCAMKRCCFEERKIETCADYPDYKTCPILQGLYSKQGYKYGKYREATEFILANGYERFKEITKNWNGAYGKYP